MQEIATLGAVTPVATSTSGKPTGKAAEKDFDRVFADKQQEQPQKSAETAREGSVKKSSQQRQEQKKVQEPVTSDRKGVERQSSESDEPVAATQVTEATDESAVVDGSAAVQQTLIALMQTLNSEKSASVDSEDVTSLVTDLVTQLENADLHGEEVLAGIDLSALKDQIEEIAAGDDPIGEMAALIARVSEQLQTQPEMTSVEMTGQLKGGSMAQARDLLQQVLGDDLSESQSAADTAAVETLTGKQDAVPIDPRFAGLLNVRQGQKSNQEAAVAKQPLNNSAVQQSQTVADETTEPIAETPGDLEAQLTAELDKISRSVQRETAHQSQQTRSGIEGSAQHGPHMHNSQGSMFADSMKNLAAAPTIQLPSGQHVAESQIFDQVVTHLSGSVNGESGRMVLRLNPAELGSLKLDVVVEGDEVRANIHAQNQQVQEVIERHLPQLRNALAEQGLKIEQFQVDIDKQQSGGSFEGFADQQQQQQQGSRSWNYRDVVEEDVIPLAQLFQPASPGISLHV